MRGRCYRSVELDKDLAELVHGSLPVLVCKHQHAVLGLINVIQVRDKGDQLRASIEAALVLVGRRHAVHSLQDHNITLCEAIEVGDLVGGVAAGEWFAWTG